MSMPRKWRHGYLVGSISTNSLVEVSIVQITKNVDRTDITDCVRTGDCFNCVGCKDEKGGIEFVPSSNVVTAGLGVYELYDIGCADCGTYVSCAACTA